jgi:shikimate dehydrogenase
MSAPPPLAGVIGWPVGHSRSPKLHGHWLKRHALPGAYVAMAVAPDALATALKGLVALGFAGCNVTLPHKEQALALVDVATDRARRIGAANTLVIRDGRIEADNTDGFGFVENLRQGAPGWTAAEGPALVLGAGGAARAIVAALLDAGAPEVLIANRTAERAEALAAALGGRAIAWAAAEAAAAEAATIVNTTSLGMAGQPPLDLSLDRARAGALATDIVYTPLETGFLKRAAAQGLRAVDGLGMLLHQARPGFEAWFGVAPAVDDDLRRAVLA